MTDLITEAPAVGTVHQINDHRATPVQLVKPPTGPIEDPVLPAGVEAVDRPDNPLADWLSVPDAPLLPAWARSRASIVAPRRSRGSPGGTPGSTPSACRSTW